MKAFCFDWGQGGFILGLILSPDVKDWATDRQGVPLKDTWLEGSKARCLGCPTAAPSSFKIDSGPSLLKLRHGTQSVPLPSGAL